MIAVASNHNEVIYKLKNCAKYTLLQGRAKAFNTNSINCQALFRNIQKFKWNIQELNEKQPALGDFACEVGDFACEEIKCADV